MTRRQKTRSAGKKHHYRAQPPRRRDPNPGRRRWARLAGGTGFLGGFTTYSTFVVESVTRAGGGALGLAFLYDAASLLAGFAATYAAVMLAARLVPTRGTR